MNAKTWLNSSLVLFAGAIAAVLTFILNIFEQGWRIKETVMAPAPPQPGIRVEDQRPYFSAPVSFELHKIPSVRDLIELEKHVKLMFQDEAKPPPRGQVGVWPARLLVLNPSKQKLTLHSCRVLVQRDSPFVSQSITYFLGDAIEKIRADRAGEFIEVDPDGARRVDVLFLFPPATFDLGSRFWGNLKDLTEKLKGGITEPRSALNRLDIQCEDQAGRILGTSTTARIQASRGLK